MATWFHGSPFRIEILRTGSTITCDRDVARIFSHKPSLVAHDEDGRPFHNGVQPGFLYAVEGVNDEDVYPHPRTSMAPGVEWLTRRELPLAFLEETTPLDDERLAPDEERSLRRQALARD